ncbi:MAG: hypothetical protein MMC33_003972 [Icmadophila ericetorum]|nr:hypothetical protein [Icmadophila ericetorum]
MMITSPEQCATRSTSLPTDVGLNLVTSAPQRTSSLPACPAYVSSLMSTVEASLNNPKLQTQPITLEESRQRSTEKMEANAATGPSNSVTPPIKNDVRSRSNSIEVVFVKPVKKAGGPNGRTPAQHTPGLAADERFFPILGTVPLECSKAGEPQPHVTNGGITLSSTKWPQIVSPPNGEAYREQVAPSTSPILPTKRSASLSASNFLAGAAVTNPNMLPRQQSVSKPWTSAIYADMAQTMQEHFPFTHFAAKHNKDPREVLKVFSQIIQAPLLRYSSAALDRTKALTAVDKNQAQAGVATEKTITGAIRGNRKEPENPAAKDPSKGNNGTGAEAETPKAPAKKRVRVGKKKDATPAKDTLALASSPTSTNAEAIERAKELKKVVDNFLKAEKSTAAAAKRVSNKRKSEA